MAAYTYHYWGDDDSVEMESPVFSALNDREAMLKAAKDVGIHWSVCFAGRRPMARRAQMKFRALYLRLIVSLKQKKIFIVLVTEFIRTQVYQVNKHRIADVLS